MIDLKTIELFREALKIYVEIVVKTYFTIIDRFTKFT